MTEREVRIINGKEVALYRHKELDSYLFAEDAVDLLLKAFEEVEQYRAIGTVEKLQKQKEYIDTINEVCSGYSAIGTIEDFKALKEKNTPKKISYQIGKNGLKHEKCPTCGSFHVFGKHCTECGQAVDYD